MERLYVRAPTIAMSRERSLSGLQSGVNADLANMIIHSRNPLTTRRIGQARWEKNIDIGVAQRILKTTRHDADDGGRFAVNQNWAADYRRISSEFAMPESVAE